MKKILTLLSLFFIAATALLSQTFPLSISGTVSDSLGNPVPYATIYIDLKVSPTGPSFYQATKVTNANGFYEDEIQITPNYPPQGILTVAMFDCDSTYQYFSAGYSINNNTFVQNFTWCSLVNSNTCWVTIEVNSVPGSSALLLTAIPDGTPNYTFFWNNSGGTNDPSIVVEQSGTYCVTVWDTTGCEASSCIEVIIDPSGSSCNVSIGADTIGSTWILTAYPNGTAPFTYYWNTGDSTQTINFTPVPSNISPCVTVTDANGCTATECFTNIPPYCYAFIVPTSTGLVANAYGGLPPYQYYWTTGETTQSIQPTEPGTYCVEVITADSCVSTACIEYNNDCSVEIFLDSVIALPYGWELFAVAQGIPPFSYQWDQFNTYDSYVYVTQPGTYCVSVTDATGCIASDCINVQLDSCQVYIVASLDPSSFDTILLAIVPGNDYYFQWNTGDTLPYIVPSGPGTYCVTVTHSSGCTATACYSYGQNFYWYNVSGFVSAEGGSPNLILQGTVYLYAFDDTTGGLSLYDQVPLMPDPTLPPLPTAKSFYDFGVVPPGEYLALAVLAPNTPGYDDYLPTYYGDVQTWQDATVIVVPHGGQLFNITLAKADSLSGPGTINGFVSEGPGLHGGSNNRGDAVEGATVLLFDDDEHPLSYRLSNSDGSYVFDGLPYGTYKLVVDIPGMPASPVWVTLSPEQPTATANFTVTEQGVTNTRELLLQTYLELWPNPAAHTLTVSVKTLNSLNATVEILSPLGQVLRSEEKNIAAGEEKFNLNIGSLPSGLYLLSLRNGNERIVKRFAKR